MRIGLMGGTFDPIHVGHLFIAEEARVRCELEKVVFFPNNRPAHIMGKTAYADAQTRFELTVLATRSNPHFQVSRVEIDRPGPSFAFDTLRFFQAEFGSEAQLFFIVGSDSIAEVPTWHRGSELFEMCRFAVTTRPGFAIEAAQRQLTKEQLARVEWLETPGLHIASRELRARVKRGWPIRYLVPPEVESEIQARDLYRS